MEPPAADIAAPSGLAWPVMLLALLSAWLLAVASPAWAARAAPGPMAESEAEVAADPPGRVGRISEVQGRVAWFDQQLGRWEEAERNLPLTSGDRLSTGDGARAELRIGSTVLRLDGSSELEVLRIDDERMVFQLHSGALALRVRTRQLASETVLLTDEVRALPQRAGHYRLGRRDDETRAGVWHGTLRLALRSAADDGAAGSGTDRAGAAWAGSDTSADAPLLLETGQYAELWRGPAAGADRMALRHRLLPPPSDVFAEWVVLDDRREDQRSAAQQHVSPEMTGVEDLDRHGRWEHHPDYGVLWFPLELRAGWAPYRYGRWVWVGPWGWTWVDQAPWGFAPFHYGRWVHWQGRWGWWPGERVARPVYAPALVAWVGGSGWNVSVQVGSGPRIGWVPLAPRERFVPPYRHTPGHLDRLNPHHRPGLRDERDGRDDRSWNGKGWPQPRRDGGRDDRQDDRRKERPDDRQDGRRDGRRDHRAEGGPDGRQDGPPALRPSPAREEPLPNGAPADAPVRAPEGGLRAGTEATPGPWRNAQVPGAVTVVTTDVLQRRQPVPREGQPGWAAPERGDWGQPTRPPTPAAPAAPEAASRPSLTDRLGARERGGREWGGRELGGREWGGRAGDANPPASEQVVPVVPGWRDVERRSPRQPSPAVDGPASGAQQASPGAAVADESPNRYRERRVPQPAPALPPAVGSAAAQQPSAVPSLPAPAPVWRQRDRDAGRAPVEGERGMRAPRPAEPSPAATRQAPAPDERKFRPDVRPGAQREAVR